MFLRSFQRFFCLTALGLKERLEHDDRPCLAEKRRQHDSRSVLDGTFSSAAEPDVAYDQDVRELHASVARKYWPGQPAVGRPAADAPARRREASSPGVGAGVQRAHAPSVRGDVMPERKKHRKLPPAVLLSKERCRQTQLQP